VCVHACAHTRDCPAHLGGHVDPPQGEDEGQAHRHEQENEEVEGGGVAFGARRGGALASSAAGGRGRLGLGGLAAPTPSRWR